MIGIRNLLAVVTIAILGGLSQAGDSPKSLPAQAPATPADKAATLPPPAPVGDQAEVGSSCAASGCNKGWSRWNIFGSLGQRKAAVADSPAECFTGAAGCAKSEKKSCFACVRDFFTYRKEPFTDVNTYCCCCYEARPPLYAYFLHAPADKAPPPAVPVLNNGCCKKDGSGTSCSAPAKP
jgi:hypothetical protein